MTLAPGAGEFLTGGPAVSPQALLRLADVALDVRSGGAEAVYTYRVDETVSPGSALIVPLGGRPVVGFALRVYEKTAGELGASAEKLKSFEERIEGVSLAPQTLDLVRFVAEETLSPISVALAAATPPGLRERLASQWALTGKKSDLLSALQAETLKVLEEAGGAMTVSPTKKLDATTERALKGLRAKGVVAQRLAVDFGAERSAADALYALCADEERVEKFLKNEGRKKPAQALTLMRLQSVDRRALSASDIKAMSGVTDVTLKALVGAGLLEPAEAAGRVSVQAPEPNAIQRLAIDALTLSVSQREAKGFLLFGVTGSGKTEVYLRAAAEALRLGRQVLYLVPEIALATQAIARLRERFGENAAILHSELPPTERLRAFVRIRKGEIPVVLGARSAAFAPLDNLGLIVMDEEHETSYKQESSPKYHTKALVKRLAELHGCPFVLGSATPGIESFQEAEEDKLTLLSLPERAASAQLPSVAIKDLSADFRGGQPAILSEELFESVRDSLARGEQAILFLNRRAYAPFVLCRDCGEQIKCPRCAVSLSLHRQAGLLRCHYCGFNRPAPEVCPRCEGTRLSPFGVGAEKVEEATKALFPEATVARLDRDIARKKGALETILTQFRTGEIQILVGTQMVAKGLDFPRVTTVGVIAADVSLNIPDFRSAERTFQLLSQVAGRAGRGDRPGHVVIQTFNPEHPAIVAAQAHDFISFFEQERRERADAGYPPNRRLVNVLFAGMDRAEVVQTADEAARRLTEAAPEEADLLGPVDSPIERLQGRWRRHLLIKMGPGASPGWIGTALEDLPASKVQTLIDVDPYNLA